MDIKKQSEHSGLWQPVSPFELNCTVAVCVSRAAPKTIKLANRHLNRSRGTRINFKKGDCLLL